MAEQSSRVQIAIAIITLVGVLGGAAITNWDKIFPRTDQEKQELLTTPTPAPALPAKYEPTVDITPSKRAGNDCLAYNPKDLQIVDEGPSGWLLTDGRSRMLILDNKEDAKNALAVAQRHTSHCFIGRRNTRPNRDDYVNEYWA